MNPLISRTLKALCIVAAAGVLTACGSSSTVDPFVPKRVIALGDDYNVADATVRVGTDNNSVAGRLATLYGGAPQVISCAAVGAKVSDLAAQIAAATAPHPECAGPFNQTTDLILITVGLNDVKDSTSTTDFSHDKPYMQQLVTAVNTLFAANAKHVLIMPALEFTRTPWGRSHAPAQSTSKFNQEAGAALDAAFGSSSTGVNKWIYASISGIESGFLLATANPTYLTTFTDTGYDATNAHGKMPACDTASAGHTVDDFLAGASPFAGCASTDTATNPAYKTMLFADGLHLTPAGNLWMAQMLFQATTQAAWR